MTNKWMPEVGQECDVYDPLHRDWKRVAVTAEGNTAILAKFEGQADELALRKTCTFRPIKTEADKYRDEQIEKLRQTMYPLVSKDIVAYFYDNGCRILADDERIVKPLTEEQIYKLTGCTDLWREDVIAVQRELGVID